MNVYKRQQCASNNKYAQTEDFKTDFERKLNRYKRDGVRMYDASYATPIEDALPIIKAVRLG
ncbi:hypothetical protein MHI57_24775 [Cytobacillus sp. FSL K6-0129]|uniref:hypothetical protein n=1 Tax=Cytobacillus sp. FSL K6-0129 TaxID=2921421 RepID=UPI0030FAFF33